MFNQYKRSEVNGDVRVINHILPMIVPRLKDYHAGAITSLEGINQEDIQLLISFFTRHGVQANEESVQKSQCFEQQSLQIVGLDADDTIDKIGEIVGDSRFARHRSFGTQSYTQALESLVRKVLENVKSRGQATYFNEEVLTPDENAMLKKFLRQHNIAYTTKYEQAGLRYDACIIHFDLTYNELIDRFNEPFDTQQQTEQGQGSQNRFS